ncbi:MAG TPA: CDP-glucose 4,6-dehydratase [Solirubrobacteraceae bacterium]|nr:CDP-glucose 4,6-dehydratase [Solirubrobacteraceae bacterium]
MEWNGTRVLVTGHTGFKGSWLSLWLHSLGARVTGLADGVPTDPSLYELARVGELVDGITADVRDFPAVLDAVQAVRPEVVIHMAAQPFVRRSFREPRETYDTNVMGTVNVLDAIRRVGDVRVALVVTSDKCYDNREQGRPFTESDPMGGRDPYSNSKGCAELVADAYRHSFFSGTDTARVATGRAGNVIGGGDWGEDRLIPDIMAAAAAGEPIPIRNPTAVRPWQHVLNPLAGYLQLIGALWDDPAFAGGWNFGPALEDARPVSWITDRIAELWPGDLRWEVDPGPHPHEAQFLALDSTKAQEQLGWTPAWDLDEALRRTVEWYLALDAGADVRDVTLEQAGAHVAQTGAVT